MLAITPEVVKATYCFVTSLHPFTKWAVPPADALKFGLTRRSDRYGDYGDGVIRVNPDLIGHLDTLVRIVAHEALHACQHLDGTETKGADHNHDFQKRAALVCKSFGIDPKVFL